ncbi:Ig-like domain-containing protein [Neobacillus citreus]|uniref:Ig-like domain-containing protein n=1 Tax=Neobacillus citreus TaxID=2833578 RepID=A0A942T2W9_9BACI|nr:Ig-like domain-containing protein [Neobacillus citreus]MCH6266561.1 Ig-like domain-containing protein [Neobacillus citreus]
MNSLKISKHKYLIFFILLLFNLTTLTSLNVVAAEPDPSTIPPNIIVKNINVNADGTVTIKGLVSDNLTIPESIKMKLVYLDANQLENDLGSITPDSTGLWSINTTFTENFNKYFIIATDGDSNEEKIPVPTPPTIIVKDIKKNADGTTTINGEVSDNLTTAENIEMKLVYLDADRHENDLGQITPDSNGSWSITRTFPDKLNRYFLVATDKSSIENEEPNNTTIFVQRPYVTSIKVTVLNYRHKIIENGISKDRDETMEMDLIYKNEMTRVVLDPTIAIDFSDGVPANINNLIYLFDKSGMVDSVTPTKSNNQLMLNFHNLKPSTTYYLMFNPSLISEKYKDNSGIFVDDNGNAFFPVIKKFTTVSETVKSTAIDETMAEIPNQPHGFYSNNVSTCSNCHSTHNGDSPSLDTPKSDYMDKAKENSYCMACHDGTLAAPMPENLDTNNGDIKSKHDAIDTPEHSSSAGSCITCHNPHITWSEDNPTLLKDHFVYTKDNGSKIDSLEVNCDTCHKDNAVSEVPDYHDNSVREVLSYKKDTTADGQSGNYSLCLRCHNGVKASDIKQYYEDQNGVIESGHSIIAINGSKLRGNIPCSVCHETHASTNLKLLKSTLGHENQDSEAFSFTTGNWDENNERVFCMKCHNGKTSIYGVKALDPLQSPGHSLMEKCSDCHGGESNSFLEAAHAPQIDPTKTHSLTQTESPSPTQ